MSTLSSHLLYSMAMLQIAAAYTVYYNDPKNSLYSWVMMIVAAANGSLPIATYIAGKSSVFNNSAGIPFVYMAVALVITLVAALQVACLRQMVGAQYHMWVRGAGASILVGFIAFLIFEGIPLMNLEQLRTP